MYVIVLLFAGLTFAERMCESGDVALHLQELSLQGPPGTLRGAHHGFVEKQVDLKHPRDGNAGFGAFRLSSGFEEAGNFFRQHGHGRFRQLGTPLLLHLHQC